MLASNTEETISCWIKLEIIREGNTPMGKIKTTNNNVINQIKLLRVNKALLVNFFPKKDSLYIIIIFFNFINII